MALRWKHNASATWQLGAFETSLSQNYQKADTDVAANRAPAGTKVRKVDACQTFDLQLGCNGIKSTRPTPT